MKKLQDSTQHLRQEEEAQTFLGMWSCKKQIIFKG